MIFCVFIFMCFICSLVIHEFGHIIIGRCVGMKCCWLRIFRVAFIFDKKIKLIYKKGVAINSVGECGFANINIDISPMDMMLMFLGGPFVNLLLALIGLIGVVQTHYLPSDKYYAIILLINFLLFISSIIPIKSDDGATTDGYNVKELIYCLVKNKSIISLVTVVNLADFMYLGDADSAKRQFLEYYNTNLEEDDYYSMVLKETQAYIFMGDGEFEKAQKEYYKILNTNLYTEKMKKHIEKEMTWIDLMTDKENIDNVEVGNEYTDIRIKYLLSKNDIAARENLEKKFKKLLEKEIYEGTKIIENRLWSKTKNKVDGMSLI
ncbi:site-2 protease family protein [Lachnospira pectinoschiza]|uniref:Peptidase M50 domain-containing protein n=1 Tax=Lachnospira pectinoschiza TaxID=28052 RepID=A0A1G9X0S5_9FIRM|nr:site-2 protease family protein [Lachnospira pectinoschiza]SDM90298.1 hypothetical protein SAMN05216544_1419 [Lachnospira pectinoschiza]